MCDVCLAMKELMIQMSHLQRHPDSDVTAVVRLAECPFCDCVLRFEFHDVAKVEVSR